MPGVGTVGSCVLNVTTPKIVMAGGHDLLGGLQAQIPTLLGRQVRQPTAWRSSVIANSDCRQSTEASAVHGASDDEPGAVCRPVLDY